MSNYYLAVDIGASSGRHMLFTIEDGKIQMEEIYRKCHDKCRGKASLGYKKAF